MIDNKALKTFGYIWALIFFVIAYYNKQYFLILSLISISFAISASFFPEIYVKTKIFQAWIKLGDYLGKVNSKIIIFFLFFMIFTPIAFILKILKKDLLQKKIDRNCATYFKPRVDALNDMKKQF